ncbi:MAG: FHA domain-containing protein [Proteobacteria bacterium]|nr:FHA domain-containing protein [Pseudomonadota bacterium]MCP4920948.1 FHA domain-containing protein [Pseudomonadota bacterium]
MIVTVPRNGSPLAIGRAPANAVVIDDDTVSWHHAMVWSDGDGLWIQDAGSRNGTFIGESRVTAKARLEDGATVRVGTTVTVAFRIGEPVPDAECWLVEDVQDGISRPVGGDRFALGPSGDLTAPIDATLLFTGPGEIWLGEDGDDRRIAVDEEFSLGGRVFRVKRADSTHAPTVEATGDRYPYRLEATLDGPRGAEARVVDLDRRVSHVVTAENRAILLVLLGRKVLSDSKQVREERGWMADHDVARGLWGRSWSDKSMNNLNVLVHRVRKEIQGAGLDPWFLEKRSGFIRARLAQVELD